MSFFKELLAIKSFRESKAEINVGKQRVVLVQAETQRDASALALSDYQVFAVAHERDLYDDLCSRLVRLSAIENVQNEVAHMREQERQRQDGAKEAEKDRVAQEARLQQLRLMHKDASRAKQKFVEFAQVYTDEQAKEFERREDAEMEEVAELRRDRVDWEEHYDGAPA
jgi:type III secretion protein O